MWQVSNPRNNTAMFLGGWLPDGKQVLYTEAVDLDLEQSFPAIATLIANNIKRYKEITDENEFFRT